MWNIEDFVSVFVSDFAPNDVIIFNREKSGPWQKHANINQFNLTVGRQWTLDASTEHEILHNMSSAYFRPPPHYIVVEQGSLHHTAASLCGKDHLT